MPNFENLRSVDASDETVVEYEIVEITLGGKSPMLIVAPATMQNKRYMNAKLKGSVKNAKKLKNGQLTVKILDELREDDRNLYSHFVVKSWSNVVDDEGDVVDFSQSNCREFIDALPAWIFDELRAFCSEISNFVDQPDDEYFIKNS